jgi:hypothetical protein
MQLREEEGGTGHPSDPPSLTLSPPRPPQSVGIAQAVQGLFLVSSAIPGGSRDLSSALPGALSTRSRSSTQGYSMRPCTPCATSILIPPLPPAPPAHAAGWMASWMRKDTILRILALVQLAGIGLLSWVVQETTLPQAHKFLVLCGALALWGLAQGNSSVVESLFADSVPTGSRSEVYSWLHVCNVAAQSLGPAIAAYFFFSTSDSWDIEVLKQVRARVGGCYERGCQGRKEGGGLASEFGCGEGRVVGPRG